MIVRGAKIFYSILVRVAKRVVARTAMMAYFSARVCSHCVAFSVGLPVDLRKAFSLLDVKNTGAVTAEALKGLLRGLGSTWTDRELVVALKSRNIVGARPFIRRTLYSFGD